MDMNILNNLKEKAGPLPEWVWIVGIAGLGYLAYKRHAAKATPSQTNTTATTGTTIDPLTGIPYNQEGNGYTGALLTAQYDELNALGNNTSQLGILNSNVGTATTALNTNTGAVNGNTTSASTSGANLWKQLVSVSKDANASDEQQAILRANNPSVQNAYAAYQKMPSQSSQQAYFTALTQGFTDAKTAYDAANFSASPLTAQPVVSSSKASA